MPIFIFFFLNTFSPFKVPIVLLHTYIHNNVTNLHNASLWPFIGCRQKNSLKNCSWGLEEFSSCCRHVK